MQLPKFLKYPVVGALKQTGDDTEKRQPDEL